jgi:hypothetical protein
MTTVPVDAFISGLLCMKGLVSRASRFGINRVVDGCRRINQVVDALQLTWLPGWPQLGLHRSSGGRWQTDGLRR